MDGQRASGLRRVRRVANWSLAGLVLGVGATAGALAHSMPPATTQPSAQGNQASSQIAVATAPGHPGTPSAPGNRAGPTVHGPVATTSGSGVAKSTPAGANAAGSRSAHPAGSPTGRVAPGAARVHRSAPKVAAPVAKSSGSGVAKKAGRTQGIPSHSTQAAAGTAAHRSAPKVAAPVAKSSGSGVAKPAAGAAAHGSRPAPQVKHPVAASSGSGVAGKAGKDHEESDSSEKGDG